MEIKATSHKINTLSLIANVLLLIGIILLAARHYYLAHLPKVVSGPTIGWSDMWNADRTDVFQKLPINKGDIVFVGNSLTEGFPLAEMYPGLPIKNRGIGGNFSKHVLSRIASIAETQPSKLFLEMGINDFTNRLPVDTVLANYQHTLAQIKTISPLTHIYIQSITPTSMEYLFAMDSVIKANIQLKELAIKNGATFINIYPLFLKNNALDSSLTYDGIHFNGRGYKMWQQAIDSIVRK